jgi:hypothetical protein
MTGRNLGIAACSSAAVGGFSTPHGRGPAATIGASCGGQNVPALLLLLLRLLLRAILDCFDTVGGCREPVKGRVPRQLELAAAECLCIDFCIIDLKNGLHCSE